MNAALLTPANPRADIEAMIAKLREHYPDQTHGDLWVPTAVADVAQAALLEMGADYRVLSRDELSHWVPPVGAYYRIKL